MGLIEDIIADTQNLILFFTFLVAVFSFVLTVVTLYWQRQHNRLSLLPIPNVNVDDHDNILTIDLENNGSGPLIIKSIIFSMDNEKTWNRWPAHCTFLSDAKKLVPITTVLHEDSVIVTNKFERLLECKYDPADPEQREELFSLIESMKRIHVLQIDYTDVYNKDKKPAWWRIWPVFYVRKIALSELAIWDDLKNYIKTNYK